MGKKIVAFATAVAMALTPAAPAFAEVERPEPMAKSATHIR